MLQTHNGLHSKRGYGPAHANDIVHGQSLRSTGTPWSRRTLHLPVWQHTITATRSLSAVTAQQPQAAAEGEQLRAAAVVDTRHKGLWGTSQHVQLVGVEEAEELYLSLVQRTNEQHVLMVLYAPWCAHCQAIEHEVETLAAGLSGQRDLLVVALNIDPPAARYFSKEVLGVNALPSFVLFPRESRTFYKYKGRGRDAQSLLKFLNMVCNQSTDQVWQLGGATTVQHTASSSLQAGQTTMPSLRQIDSNAMWTAAGLALAACAVLYKFFSGRAAAHQAFAATIAATTAPTTVTPATGAGNSQDLKQQINGTMGRMGGLMVKLAGARVSLDVLDAKAAVGALVTGEGGQQLAEGASAPLLPVPAATSIASGSVDVLTQPVNELPAPSDPAQAAGAVADTVAEAAESVVEVEAVEVDTRAVAAPATVDPVVAAPATQPTEAATEDAQPPVTIASAVQQGEVKAAAEAGEVTAAGVAGEVKAAAGAGEDLMDEDVDQAVAALDTQELLRLLDEEGNDVDKVVQRLLQAKGEGTQAS